MSLTKFTATAATCRVNPGQEAIDPEGWVNIRNQLFTDIVESQDKRIAGTNRPNLNLKVNPQNGTGALHGSFALSPSEYDGEWNGEMEGRIEQGMVLATGLAKGTGDLEGLVLQVAFQQIAEYPREHPCDNPSAFFEMNGLILE